MNIVVTAFVRNLIYSYPNRITTFIFPACPALSLIELRPKIDTTHITTPHTLTKCHSTHPPTPSPFSVSTGAGGTSSAASAPPSPCSPPQMAAPTSKWEIRKSYVRLADRMRGRGRGRVVGVMERRWWWLRLGLRGLARWIGRRGRVVISEYTRSRFMRSILIPRKHGAAHILNED